MTASMLLKCNIVRLKLQFYLKILADYKRVSNGTSTNKYIIINKGLKIELNQGYLSFIFTILSLPDKSFIIDISPNTSPDASTYFFIATAWLNPISK
jgi:hypothetical protein